MHSTNSFNKQDYTLVEKYASIFKEFKYKLGKRFLIYYPYFFLRRSLYVLILYNLFNYPGFQVALNITHSLITVIYLIKFKPFEKDKVNLINLIQEIFVLITFGLSGLFLIELETQMKSILEIIIIIIVSIVITISYAYGLVELIIQLKTYLIHRKRKFQISTSKVMSSTINNFSNPIKVNEENKENLSLMTPRNSEIFVSPSVNKSFELEQEKLRVFYDV